MLYEYAIDPKLLLRWAASNRDYREFMKHLGRGQPRLMAEFPKRKRWRRLALSEMPADWRDTTKERRLTELVAALAEDIVRRSGFEYDGNSDWDENISAEDHRDPFDYVLVREGSAYRSDHSLTCEDIFDTRNGCELWEHEKQFPIARQAQEFASCLGNMLRLSRKIVFVDPWLRGRVDVTDVVVACLRAALQCRHSDALPEVEFVYDVNVDNSPVPQTLHAAIAGALGPLANQSGYPGAFRHAD